MPCRRPPRARSTVRAPSPPASPSIQSPTAIAAGLALDPVVKSSSRRSHPPPASSTPHPPILALCPLSPRSSRGPRTPQSDGRPRVLLTSSRCPRESPSLLPPGLHRRAPAGDGCAAIGAPLPASRCCRTC
ncbi:hypothetical protein VPH35_078097 [Triticum aestivum]